MTLLLVCTAAAIAFGADGPMHTSQPIAATLGDVVGVQTHAGYPGVALDFWRADDPSYGHKWGNSSAPLGARLIWTWTTRPLWRSRPRGILRIGKDVLPPPPPSPEGGTRCSPDTRISK